MVTLATADNALKSFYLDAVKESLDVKVNPFFAKIQKTTADVYGKDVKKLVKLGINGGIGAGTETGDLPTASGNEYVQLTSTLKNLYGTIEISDKAMRASASNEGAFVNLLNDEMDSLVKASAFNFSRMLFGSTTGKLAEFVLTYGGNKYKMDTVKNLAVGMIVDCYDLDNLKQENASGRRIVSIDTANDIIVLGGKEIGEAEIMMGSTLVLQGSRGNELCGLDDIFNADTLYGVKKSECSYVKPYVKEEVCDITESVIQTAIDEIEETCGGKVNFIICSWGVKRALAEYYRQTQTNMQTTVIEGGYTALSFNGIPVIADRFCPAGTMYLLNTDDFKLHQLCDWQWLEGDGGKILQKNPNKPVYSATLVKYAELMCERPCGQGKLTGINEV